MPLVRGEHGDDPHRPRGRIRNTRKLLATAGIIMSVMLLGSSIVTAMLIDPKALITEGQAANRALAYVAHGDAKYNINPLFGPLFGTIYDMSTVAILWFAGASAMSGLLNLVPRYLPRFGMRRAGRKPCANGRAFGGDGNCSGRDDFESPNSEPACGKWDCSFAV